MVLATPLYRGAGFVGTFTIRLEREQMGEKASGPPRPATVPDREEAGEMASSAPKEGGQVAKKFGTEKPHWPKKAEAKKETVRPSNISQAQGVGDAERDISAEEIDAGDVEEPEEEDAGGETSQEPGWQEPETPFKAKNTDKAKGVPVEERAVDNELTSKKSAVFEARRETERPVSGRETLPAVSLHGESLSGADGANEEPSPAPPGAEVFLSPVDGSCEGCGITSFLRANPVEEVMRNLVKAEEEPTAAVEVKPISPTSIIEDICIGCDLLSLLFGNPAEELITNSAPGPFAIETPWAASRDAEAAGVEVFKDSDADSNQVAEVLTPRDNETPTREEYIAALNAAEADPPELAVAPEPAIGLPIDIRRDIEVKVFFEGEEEGVSLRLLKKAHPMEGPPRGVEVDITEVLEQVILAGDSGLRRIFNLARAENGVYSLIVENGGVSTRAVSVSLVLHGGLKTERSKSFEDIEVTEGKAREIKFLMPEAVFWDDEDYFSGMVEGPGTVTKFNDKTGLVWKEKTGP